MGGRNYSIYFLLALLILPTLLYGADNLIQKGIDEYRNENFEEALLLLKEAKESFPESSVAAYYLGLSHKQTGNFDEAVKNLTNALQLTPKVLDAYTDLIEILYNLDRLDEAREWIKKAEEEGVKPGHIAFLKGLVFSKKGNYNEAVKAFRKSGREDPSLAQSADLQIAMMQVAQRKFEEAESSFRAVIAIDPASKYASYAREYERAVKRTLDSYKAWRITLGAFYAFDDNVVLQPTTSTGVSAVDDTGEDDSAMAGNFRVDYTPLISAPWTFTARYNLYANNYDDINSHDTVNQSLSLIPGYGFGKGSFTLPVSYAYVFLDRNEYLSELTIKPTWTQMISPSHILQFSLSYADRDLLRPSLFKDEERDADVYGVSVGYIHPFSENRGMLSIWYDYTKDEADGRNWDKEENKISLSLLMPLTKKLTLTTSGDISFDDYDNRRVVDDIKDNTSFRTSRNDIIWYASAALRWEATSNFSLIARYAHTRNDSDIYVYDYRRNVYTAGVEYKF